MPNLLQRALNYFRKTEISIKTEGIFSEDFSVLERTLASVEKISDTEWKKDSKEIEYTDEIWRIEEGIRQYSSKITSDNGSPYRNNGQEAQVRILTHYQINYGKYSGEAVGLITVYRLELYDEKAILGSARGKDIEQLFQSVEHKVLQHHKNQQHRSEVLRTTLPKNSSLWHQSTSP